MNNSEELFYSAQNDIIYRNEIDVGNWSMYKEGWKDSQALLEQLPERMSWDVMVPISSKAMMRGKIVHTNEFLISLGDSYFVKKTAKQCIDYCERKIKSCDEMISNLDKERSLFENKLRLPIDNEVFGSADRPEIIEHVTEAEDLEWRKAHRERERAHRKKLAGLKEKEKVKIETEEDLWKRLDYLELEEELEDELQRLHAEVGSDEGSEAETEESVDLSAGEEENGVDDCETDCKSTKKCVVFAEDKLGEELSAEPLYLHFEHSDAPYSVSEFSGSVGSPGEIYHKYIHELRNTPTSILKVKKNPNKMKELAKISVEDELQYEEGPIRIESGLELRDVQEKRHSDIKPVGDGPEEPKRISKFKASRMKNHS